MDLPNSLFPKNRSLLNFKDLKLKNRLNLPLIVFSKNYQRIKANISSETVNILTDRQSADTMSNQDQEKLSKQKRLELIKNYLEPAGVNNPRVLKAFEQIPRHEFVGENYRNDAYLDIPLPIGENQTISQPSLVAVMTQALNLKGNEKVLEVGTGSGYQAAILSKLAKEVYTVEINKNLANNAAANLIRTGCTNTHVIVGDGSLGLPTAAPFDAVIVTAAANIIPQPLIDQLKNGGRIVIPVGETLYGQELKVGTKKNKALKLTSAESVMFVPLHGEYGWKENLNSFISKQKISEKYA